jgi:hypothetical protein
MKLSIQANHRLLLLHRVQRPGPSQVVYIPPRDAPLRAHRRALAGALSPSVLAGRFATGNGPDRGSH